MAETETLTPNTRRKTSLLGRILVLLIGVGLAVALAWFLTGDVAERKLLEFRSTPDLEQEVKSSPASPWPYYTLGIRYARSQRLTDATRMFEKARARYPDAFEIRYALGKAYIYEATPQKAIPEMEKSVALHPNDATSYTFLAMARRLSGDKETAKDAAKRATELDPHNAEAWYQYGVLYTAEENNEIEGRPFLKKAVEIDPNSGVYNFAYGSSLTNGSQFGEAIPYLRQALQRLPDNAYAHFLLAVCLHRSGKGGTELDEAKSELQHAIQLSPNDYRAHFELGNILEEQSQFAAALPEFQTASRLSPQLGEIWFHLSRMLDRNGHPADAAQARARFMEIRRLHVEFQSLSRHILEHPEDTAAQLRIGQVMEKQGNFKGAALQYNDVVNREPQNAQARALFDNLRRRLTTPNTSASTPTQKAESKKP